MAYGNLASKGRYGDTEIRNVAGRKSHVNKTEASLIDALGRKGEALTQALGSGTRNPMTGMPEYNWWKKQKKKAKKWWNKKVKPIGKMNVPEAGIYAGTGGLVDVSSQGAGAVNYDVFGSDQDPGTATPTNDFDPSSADFRQMVTETGDYSQLIEGYGLEAGDTQFFDQPNMEQLGFVGEQFDISADRISTGRDTLTEGLRAATSAYDIGMESAGLQAGRGITGSRQQGATARSRSGLATSGTIDTQQRSAGKGIWQDYTQQQKTLSNQMTSAQSTFDIGQTSLDIDTAAADLAKRRGESAFWEGLESDFYTMAGNL